MYGEGNETREERRSDEEERRKKKLKEQEGRCGRVKSVRAGKGDNKHRGRRN
jgi:hypothetical protein